MIYLFLSKRNSRISTIKIIVKTFHKYECFILIDENQNPFFDSKNLELE